MVNSNIINNINCNDKTNNTICNNIKTLYNFNNQLITIDVQCSLIEY